MKTNNIFELIGNDENALTKSLAFQCTLNRDAILKAVLNLLGIKRISSEALRNVKIEVQLHEEKKGITDIEFELENKFIIILEAKIDATTPADWEDQLYRYHSVLKKKDYPIKKLVFVSDTIQKDNTEFAEIEDGIEHLWVSWKEIYKKLNKLKEMDNNVIDRQFMKFFKEMLMEEEIVIVPIGDMQGGLDAQIEWKITEERHIYRKSAKPRDARYIAFYIKGIGIKKLAKLKLPYTKTTWGELNKKVMRHYYPNDKDYNDFNDKGKAYLLEFDDIFDLPRVIPSGGYGPRNPIYCTFEELLTAESVKKLHKK